MAVPLQVLRYGTPTGMKLSDAVLTQAAMSIAIFGQAALKRVSAFVLCGWSICRSMTLICWGSVSKAPS